VNPNAEVIRAEYIHINNTWNGARARRLLKLGKISIDELAALINMDTHKLKTQIENNKLSGEVKLHLHNLETSVLNKRLHPSA